MTPLPNRTLEIPKPRVEVLLGWTLVLAVQGALLAAYLTARGLSPSFFHIAPFVWITVGLWAVWWTRPAPASGRQRTIALSIAAGYLLVVGFVAGLFAVAPGGIGHPSSGWRFEPTYPPGYGPALFYAGDYVRLAFVPYLLVGYTAVSYLVYVTVLDASRSAAGGLFGLVACVGCAWPILAPILTGVAGGGTALATAAYSQEHVLSTVAFLAAIGFLTWRPLDRGDD